MGISVSFIRIVFVLLPGIIASKLYDEFVGNEPERDLDYFVKIITFSIFSYAVYDVGCFWSDQSAYICIFNFFFSESLPDLILILFVSVIGMLLAVVAAGLKYKKVVNRLGRWLRVTNRFGDETVWDYLLNSPNIGWVYVRDHKYNLAYLGYISKFSDSNEYRELLLEEVSVYSNLNGKKLYDLDGLYLIRLGPEITLELPEVVETKKLDGI